MPRAIQPETEAVNADSFLDIVASIVSIIIIMVVLTGLKIKNTPVDAPLSGEAARVDAELKQDRVSEQSLVGDVYRTAAQIEDLQRQTTMKQRERDLLALAVHSLEQKIQGDPQQEEQQRRQDAGLTDRLSEARNRLDQLQRQSEAVESAAGPSVQIECYPTPISRTVDGREIHFQLRNGRVVFVPVDALVEKFRRDAENKKDRLFDMPEFGNTVGPEGGFRLRYIVERDKFVPGVRVSGQLRIWTLIPVSDDLGEPTEAALAEGSQFRQALAGHAPQYTTVTIWTYPDSFDAFRQVKKELYRLGYAVAARPLAEGLHISGSPHGTKSAAE